jgi:amino acid adenylation domain-containing protein
LETVDAAAMTKLPNYVRARSVLEGVDEFDAAFFGMYPAEAELADPQHRLFLECAWEALEDAGCDPENGNRAIGVFAGCSPSTYFLANVCKDRDFIDKYTGGYQVGNYPTMLGANTDFLSTRVSYKFNLRGPSFTMHAGCATSLLAVSQACQSLAAYQCDVALAGGASITLPQKRGYLYDEGGMVSPDGRCRPFDANAQGTVFGSGVGAVVLKRLEDALADGDQICAVIRGWGVNNDGSGKVGFTAPSVEGQAAAIAMAQAVAGTPANTITYIEAHGTATPLGDPVEFAGLTKAFRLQTEAKGFCGLGSVKSNVGHLDVAGGVAGLIKTALALRHKQIPPTLYFERPNPRIEMAESPFYVVSKLTTWPQGATARRAGVSAAGVGGTNVHLIVEEAPPAPVAHDDNRPQVLVLSAKSETALDAQAANLAEYLRSNPEASLRNVAYTLQSGRRQFEHRCMLVAENAADAAAVLSAPRDHRNRIVRSSAKHNNQNVAFLFPGQGAQYAGMGAGIYRQYAPFRNQVDRCAAIAEKQLGFDLRKWLYPDPDRLEEAASAMQETAVAQAAIFTTEYALAQLWMESGIQPSTMIGHSVGEFVAACIAGVFSVDQALNIIVARGRLMQNLPGGLMLAVRLPEREVAGLLNGSLSMAAVNGPSLCVASGPADRIERLEEQLRGRAAQFRRLPARHAFHSAMMDPIIEPFTEVVRQVPLRSPKIRYVSGLSGSWVTDRECTDPSYWARHFRQTVRFSEGIQLLRKSGPAVLLEVGPGHTLSTLARQHPGDDSQRVVESLPDSPQSADEPAILNALGQLWLAGVRPRWESVHSKSVRRVSLPTYPFERKRFWIAAPRSASLPTSDSPVIESSPMSQTQSTISAPIAPNRQEWLIASVLGVLEDLSGLTGEALDTDKTFLELGLDSLFLTQLTQAVHAKWNVRISFRQIMDDCGSIAALASYLDRQLPPEVQPPAPAAEAPVPPAIQANPAIVPVAVAIPATNGTAPSDASSSVERILRDQLQVMSQLMAQQFEVLRQNVAQAPAIQSSSPVVAAAAPDKPKSAAAPTSSPEPKAEFKPFGPYKPVQSTPAASWTPRQQAHLDALVSRYCQRLKGSKELTQSSRSVLADPRAAAGFRAAWKELVFPIVSARSKGSKFWDVDGNEYIDIVNGYGPIFFGHMPDFVQKAIAEQLEKGIETGPQSPMAGEVAKLVSELTGMDRVTFCNTGSEAVLAALRISRTVTARNKVVMFSGDYHGMFDEVLAKPIKRAGQIATVPVAPGIPQSQVDNITVLDYGTPESLHYIRDHASELAAILVEPVQSRHPDLQPVEFLRELRRITESSGTVLIFDEVVTGFRVHPGGVQALFNIRADIATYGKVLAGGMPIGIVAGRRQYMDALDGGHWNYGDDSIPEVGVTFFAGTFVRHPLALAAAKAVLTEMKRLGPALQENLNRRTASFAERLNTLFSELGFTAVAAPFSSLFYLQIAPENRWASLLFYHLREKGIHIQEGFPCFLTASHSDEDLARIEAAFRDSILEMQAGELLPTLKTDAVQKVVALPAPETAPVIAPLTESQREIWLSAALCDEASCAYNEAFTLQMRGSLDESALRKALGYLVARHQALRATIASNGENMVIQPGLDLDTPVVDLSQTAADQRQQSVDEIVLRDARTPFDLARGPLVRTQLLRLDHDHHCLLFTSHHIVCDGWSTNVLLDELSRIYNALRAGTSWTLPPATSFAQYATQQATKMGDEDRKVEDYWLKEFAEIPQPLNLPLDRPRKSARGYQGATHRHKIGRETHKLIRRAGAQKGCTVFVSLLAGFQALLCRLSGQEETVIGIPAAGQALLEDQVLVGHCVNFLPIRARVSPDMAAESLLLTAKKRLLDAYEHQSYTYGTLVRKLSIPRDPVRLPLIDVQFNVERVGSRLEMDGLGVSADPSPKACVNFDMFVNIVESEEGLSIDCDYSTELFDAATIERWMNCYELLLRGMAGDLSQPVSSLPMLGTDDLRHLLGEWAGRSTEYPGAASLAQLFEEQCVRLPNAVALSCHGKNLTYSDLNGKANQLARYLMQNGAAPGAAIGVCLERSVESIVAILGILKAEGAYVPLDPSYPIERLRFLTEDSGMTAVVTEKRFESKLPSGVRTICLDIDAVAIGVLSTVGPVRRSASGDSLAYIMYTSGSTGQPKGVLIPHRAVVRLVKNTNYASLGPEEVFLQLAPLSFDASTFEIWAPLLNGGRLVIMAAGLQSLDEIARTIREDGVTTLWLTAGLFHAIVDQKPQALQPLRQLLAGGDVLSPDHIARFLDSVPTCRLINGYGPTEGTTFTCCHTIESCSEGSVPIGRPIANTRVYVLDARQQPVPIGVAGELYIGGDGLANGYLNQPELTADRFVHVELPSAGRVRLYRSGDLVRWRNDGTIEFIGRIDNQVKVLGYRVETGEIESIMRQHPGVQDAAVVARENPSGGRRLVGYLVVDSGQSAIARTPLIHNLRVFLKDRLPEYMVPSAFVELPAFPLTANGKIDRSALPAPEQTDHGAGRRLTPPALPYEKELLDIWRQVFLRDEIGVEDSFFEIGGDSLMIFKMTALASSKNLNFPPQSVFQRRTIRGLAQLLVTQSKTESDGPVLAPVSRSSFRRDRSSLS